MLLSIFGNPLHASSLLLFSVRSIFVVSSPILSWLQLELPPVLSPFWLVALLTYYALPHMNSKVVASALVVEARGFVLG